MYAIISTGGKQYKVQAGDTFRVEKLEGELGSELELKDVLVVGGDETTFGAPTVDGAKVTVVVTNQAKLPKVVVFKKKRRQGYRRMKGHRQFFTELFVKEISGPAGKDTASEKPQVYSAEKAQERKQKAAETRQQEKDETRQSAEGKAARKATKKKATAAKKTKKKTASKKTKAKKKKTATKKKKKTKSTAAKKTKKKSTATKKKTATKKTKKKTASKKKTTKKKS